MKRDEGRHPSPVKERLRSEILRRRDGLPTSDRLRLSADIMRRITALAPYHHARTILAYSSFGSEPDTSPLLQKALEEGKILLLPRVERASRRLTLHRVHNPEKELVPGTWGIREPDPDLCPEIPPSSVEFVLVPGVAFDPGGGRLGYGGGFYDHLISKELTHHPPLVAAAFEVQMVPEIPRDEHDVPIDLVVTEKHVYSQPSAP